MAWICLLMISNWPCVLSPGSAHNQVFYMRIKGLLLPLWSGIFSYSVTCRNPSTTSMFPISLIPWTNDSSGSNLTLNRWKTNFFCNAEKKIKRQILSSWWLCQDGKNATHSYCHSLSSIVIYCHLNCTQHY